MSIEVVTDDDILSILKQYYTNHRRFVVPFNAISYYDDYRILEWSATKICKFIQNNVECRYFMCYKERNIIFYLEDNDMVAKYSIEIPYGSRSKYYNFMYQVNCLVNEDGYVGIFVNNLPYHLKAYFVVETKNNQEQIEALIQKYSLTTTSEKGLDEFLEESLCERKWNSQAFGNKIDKNQFFSLMRGMFLFAEEQEMSEKGFHQEVERTRKKV